MKLPTLGLRGKPQLTIHLNETRSTFQISDKISGRITIKASSNVRFDHLDIQFLGVSKTVIENIRCAPGTSTARSASHNFLKLTQPISESSYPQPRILEAGKTYEFPFLFVVPQHLLPRACCHAVHHESIRDQHLQLPPSLGGYSSSEGWTGSKMDDFCPEMANISYHVAARLQGENRESISLQKKVIDVMPSFDEQPPVNVDGPDSDWAMRKEKCIKKSLFKGRLGSLVVESDQPKSLRLSADHSRSSAPVSTSAKIKLRFDPADSTISPPKLGTLSSKIKINTWFSDTARAIVPNKKCFQYDPHQSLYFEFVNLSSRSMENVEWKFEKDDSLPAIDRRDSAVSNTSASNEGLHTASERYEGKGFYTAEIIVPVTLPMMKRFVPSFHSCLISRTYGLYLNLSVQGGTMTAPSLQLKLPIQVSAEGKLSSTTPSALASLTIAEQIEEARIADEFFVPRTISPVDPNLMGNSTLHGSSSGVPVDMPPDYERLTHPVVEIRAVA